MWFRFTTKSLFAPNGPGGPCYHSQTSGNPVRIGDGCATVSGYKLPTPLVSLAKLGRRERGQAPSQDIGLAVLVMIPLGINFSVKRRMRPACLVDARQDSLNAFILRFAGSLKVFYFRTPRWSLNVNLRA